jgi:valyl-tRNA synthetase
MENIRDWCISRQLWWGHQIPVWYCQKCGETIVSKTVPQKCFKCNSTDLKQDPDVLDTWFSSWLWTFSTLGWPEKTKDLEFFYPTKSLFTASEIIFLWVARMVMAGYEFKGELCFEDVCIHGTVRDANGVKMSKSLGNGIDPLDVIKEHGADSLRFSLVLTAPDGQDPCLSFNSFELGRNFCNKLWNASRLVMMNLHEFNPQQAEVTGQEDFTLADKWILTRLQQTVGEVTRDLDDFRFNLAGKALYDFFWRDFCDWYLELIKPRYRDEHSSQDGYLAKKISVHVLEQILRLLSPFIPFVTEQIWRNLYGYDSSYTDKSLMVQPWPMVQEKLKFAESLEQMGKLQEIIVSIRNLKSELGLATSVKPSVILRCEGAQTIGLLTSYKGYITDLARIQKPEISSNAHKPAHSATSVVSDVEIYLPLEGLVNLDEEKKKFLEEEEKLVSLLAQAKARLEDQNFLNKAPASIVEKEKSKREDLEIRLTKIRKNLEALI